MKRLIKIICGVAFALLGIAAFIWSGYYLLHGRWEFTPIVISGIGLVIVGLMWIRNEKLRTIFESLDDFFLR